MMLFVVGTVALYLIGAGFGARSEFFEEHINSFKMGNNGAWEHNQLTRSNGKPPTEFAAKIKARAKQQEGSSNE
ncbi:MAG TPA: hypothetical protein V6D15_25915 [Oculatellaceae cyanobacterium]|jgi:hypothetical protein